MVLDDRFYMRIGSELKERLIAYAETVPGDASDVVREAIGFYLDHPPGQRINYGVFGPDGRLMRLFGRREGAESFVRGLGDDVRLDASGEWYYLLDEDEEPSMSGWIRPLEVE